MVTRSGLRVCAVWYTGAECPNRLCYAPSTPFAGLARKERVNHRSRGAKRIRA